MQLANPGGAFLGPPIRVGDSVPGVLGLVSPSGAEDGPGWLLFRYDRLTTFIMIRHLARDGTLGPERRLGDQTTREVRISIDAMADGGFVAAWEQAVGGRDTVRARRFDASLAPMGPSLLVPTVEDRGENWPAVAGDGDDWIVVFEKEMRREVVTRAVEEMRIRRYRGITPLGPPTTIGDAVEITRWFVSGLTPMNSAAPVGGFSLRFMMDTPEGDFALHERIVTATDITDPTPIYTDAGYLDIQLVPRAPADGRTITTDTPSLFQFSLAAYPDESVRFGAYRSTEPLPMRESMLLDAVLFNVRRSFSVGESPRGTWVLWEALRSHPSPSISLFLMPHVTTVESAE